MPVLVTNPKGAGPAFSSLQPRHDLCRFLESLGSRCHIHNTASKHLGLLPAVESLGGLVPKGYPTLGIGHDDGVGDSTRIPEHGSLHFDTTRPSSLSVGAIALNIT